MDEMSPNLIETMTAGTDPPPPNTGDEFDPVREIKRLRQDLAHRLRELQERESENGSILSEAPKVDVKASNPMSEKNADSLSHHMRQVKKLLSRLQVNTIVRNQSPELPFSPADLEAGTANVPTGDNFVGEVQKSESDVVSSQIGSPSNVLRSDEKRPDPSVTENKNGLSILDRLEEEERKNRGGIDLSRLDPLKMANIGLTVSGLLIMPIGAALHCNQGDSSVGRGALLLLAGALIVGFGLFGHFYAALRGKIETENISRSRVSR